MGSPYSLSTICSLPEVSSGWQFIFYGAMVEFSTLHNVPNVCSTLNSSAIVFMKA